MTEPGGVAQPQAPDETSVFIVEPDGWYGILSLRSPFVRRKPAKKSERGLVLGDYGRWIPRLIGETHGLEWVSCVPVMQCWHARFSTGQLNEYALTMLGSVAVHLPEVVLGTAVFTGQGDDMGQPVGLQPEQLEPIAAAYRMAQRKLISKD